MPVYSKRYEILVTPYTIKIKKLCLTSLIFIVYGVTNLPISHISLSKQDLTVSYKLECKPFPVKLSDHLIDKPSLKLKRSPKTPALTRDFQQCGILTSVDSDGLEQPPFKLRNTKCCSVSGLTVIELSSD